MSSSGVKPILYPPDQIDFLRIFLILGATLLVVAFLQRLIPWLAERLPARFRPKLLPLGPALRLVILTGALLQITPLVINPDPPQNILVVLGASGVALGFAFKDYASGLIAGIVAIYERPYRVGDRITIDGAYGEVRAIGLRALKLVTPDDTVVSLPHTKIWTSGIHNANDGNRSQLCVADFYLHPDHDPAAVRAKLLDVARSSPLLELRLPLTVVIREEPWGTHYRLKAYPIDGREEFAFVSDLTLRGKLALAGLGARPALAPAVPSAPA